MLLIVRTLKQSKNINILIHQGKARPIGAGYYELDILPGERLPLDDINQGFDIDRQMILNGQLEEIGIQTLIHTLIADDIRNILTPLGLTASREWLRNRVAVNIRKLRESGQLN